MFWSVLYNSVTKNQKPSTVVSGDLVTEDNMKVTQKAERKSAPALLDQLEYYNLKVTC